MGGPDLALNRKPGITFPLMNFQFVGSDFTIDGGLGHGHFYERLLHGLWRLGSR